MLVPGSGLAASGIDWHTSTMMVEFTPESGFVPPFDCFGATNMNDVACLDYVANGGTEDHCVWSYLSDLGYSDTNLEPEITNCFQQAGDYIATIELYDYAGNVIDPVDENIFSILPGPPDSVQSELNLDPVCEDLSLIANNSDTCAMTLVLKDAFGNPVTQLKGQTGQLYSEAEFADDANAGDLNFRTGTKIDGSFIPDESSTFLDFTIGSTDEVVADLLLTSWAPSIRKQGAFLGVNETFEYDFHFVVPSVDESGALDLGNMLTLEYNQFSPSVGFYPWAKTLLSIEPPYEFLIDVAKPLNVIRNLVLPATGGPNTLVNLYLTHHNLPSELTVTGVAFNPTSVGITAQNTTVYPVLEVVSEGASVAGTIAFSSELSYEITDGSIYEIRYPSGAIGAGILGADGGDDYDDEIIDLTFIGASIEGKILGSKDKGIIQDFNAVRLGQGVAFEDIREEIFQNAFKIARGVDPLDTSALSANALIDFDNSWFTNSNVAIVEGFDVRLGSESGTFNLPTGKNTLILRNANLIIDGDYDYADSLDSFGFIIVNDAIVVKPATGNIFIRNDVKKIVGTFFAEGAMATVSESLILDNTGDITTSDISNGDELNNTTQLLFEGTLLTHNTLGGAIDRSNGAPYYTPWDDSLGTDLAAKAEAIDYDLHYIRHYSPDYSGDPIVQNNTADCVPGGDSFGCDANNNAFVIRYDGRATKLAPPGFEEASFFGR